MKTKKLLLLLFFIGLVSYSQQDAQYTQYMYNTETINPAYAGSRGVLSIFGLYRAQWVGLDGAPKTSNFSINTPIENSNIGVGLTLLNDQIGPTVSNAISADLSYTIRTSELYKLSFGLKGTANFFNFYKEKLNPQIITDPTLGNLNNYFSLNLGAGAYLHSNKMYLGLSVPNFFQTKMYHDNEYAVYTQRMNIYFIGGYVFNLSPDIKFKPAFLVKTVEGAPLQLDLSGNLLFNEKFMLGAAYRWDAAGSLMAGFQVSDGLYIGYGYDIDTTKLVHYNSGSHEIFLRYEFFKPKNRIVSPRFF
jgi:type IX secretion system PorP/SprF family membrane protein